MKRRGVSLILATMMPILAWSQGIQPLVNKTAAVINEVMQARYNPSATIIAFENHTELTDMAAQKFYQLLVSRLESTALKGFSLMDSMVGFNGGKGRFHNRGMHEAGFLISLKMIRSAARIGVGVSVFSRRTDRLVAVRYVSEIIPPGELRILNIPERSFASTGFAMVTRMQADTDLMDICSRAEPDGRVRHYFLSPEKIDIFEWQSRRMVRLLSLPIDWGRPFTPARHMEGRILVFFNQMGTWLTAGANISPNARVFLFQEGKWGQQDPLDFVPLRHVMINDIPYLAGMRYSPGRNFFQGGLVLMPLDTGRPEKNRMYEKPLPEAYALDFTTGGGRLAALHLVDRDYHYRVYTRDFENSTADERLRGGSLGALDSGWLAVSDYSRGNDRAFFFSTREGGLREVYEEEFPSREIRFIRPGIWDGDEGFWICLEGRDVAGPETELQFWKKNKAPENSLEAEKNKSDQVEDVHD